MSPDLAPPRVRTLATRPIPPGKFVTHGAPLGTVSDPASDRGGDSGSSAAILDPVNG